MSSILSALQVAEASNQAIFSENNLQAAADFISEFCSEFDREKAVQALFRYSADLTANTATRVTMVLMSESEFSAVCDQIREFDQIEKDVLGE